MAAYDTVRDGKLIEKMAEFSEESYIWRSQGGHWSKAEREAGRRTPRKRKSEQGSESGTPGKSKRGSGK